MVLTSGATEQRVSGGRLFLQGAGGPLYTKIMSNGVEVIVRGTKTTLFGGNVEGHTPWLPHKVIGHPSRPVTLPAYTVSRHFHLIDKQADSKKPANQVIAALLQSIVRSSTPDLVTKTVLTTFTYLTTLLNKASNTLVKSREEVISNVMTQKFRPSMEYTASLKLHEGGVSSFAHVIPTSWVTRTLTTTYAYFNTFLPPTGDSSPLVISSTEVISNIVTLPAYLDAAVTPLHLDYGGIGHYRPTTSTLRETETYFSTYTFSRGVSTRRETVTQVVVTEIASPLLLPPSPLLTPTATPPQDLLTKTYFTTFTHRFTERLPGGGTTVRSSTRLTSDLVTERLPPASFEEMAETPLFVLSSRSLAFPLRSSTLEVTRTLTPVMLYATKVYYTTYTYFTTVRNRGGGATASLRVHSRTQVVSRVVTEALSTAFDEDYVAQLKSNYLKEHSSLVDVASQVTTIIPTKTIDLHEFIEPSVTLEGAGVGSMTPHWPKDDGNLGPFEVFDFEKEKAEEIRPTEGVTTTLPLEEPSTLTPPPPPPKRKVITRIHSNIHKLSTPISSSEEHFDEVREEVKEIVSVLTNTQVTPTFPADVYPTKSAGANDAAQEDVDVDLSSIVLEDVDAFPNDPVTSRIPVSHLPTPPLNFKLNTISEEAEKSVTSSAASSAAASSSSVTSKYKVPSKYTFPSREKIPEDKTQLDMFPELGVRESASSVKVDFPSDLLGGSGFDYPSIPSEEEEADSWRRSTSILAKRTGTILFDNFSPKSPTVRPLISPVPTSKIVNLISALVDDLEEEEEEEEERSPEEEAPQKVYDLGGGTVTFGREPVEEEKDSGSAYVSVEEIKRLNATLQLIKRQQDKPTTTTEKPTTTPKPTTTTTTTTEAPPPPEESEQEVEAEETEAVVEKEEEEAPEEEEEPTGPSAVEKEEEHLEEEEEGSGNDEAPPEEPEILAEENEEPAPVPPTEQVMEVEEGEEGGAPPKVEEGAPSPDVPTPAQEPPPPKVLETPPPEKDESLSSSQEESSEDFFTLPGHKNVVVSTKRPSTKAPSKRPNSKRPQRPSSMEEDSREDEQDDSTHIYKLGPSSSSSSKETEEEEEEQKRRRRKKKKPTTKRPPPLHLDDEEEDSPEVSSEENVDKRRPSTRPTGPSKSGLTFPLAAGAGSAAIATAATSSFNWKPLLNLGAIGLGGLGASGLTKLGPLFNSVAGYMKGALIPTIARNDTFQGNGGQRPPQKKGRRPGSDLQRGQRPYSRLPPKEAPVRQGKEPIYIPLKENENNFRYSDPGIPRRPVVSTANEPNLLRPSGGGTKEPFGVQHNLHFPPGNFGGHGGHGGQFPMEDVMNFKPPDDMIPNIFTQMDVHGNDPHKHGNPPQPDTRPGGSNLPSHSPGGGGDHGNVVHIVPGDPFAHPPTPEGKTSDFFSRPFHNLMSNSGRAPFPPGRVTPVEKPPGHPGSVEVLNEIRDYPRKPPQSFLPQRNSGIVVPSKKPGSLPWPFNTEKFQKDPFHRGQFGPPGGQGQQRPSEVTHPHDSFEADFQPENHEDFFNQPGFISEDQFAGGVTTPKPLRRPPPTQPPPLPGKPAHPRLPGEPPMLPEEMNPQRGVEPPHNPQGNIPPHRPWKVPPQVSLGSWPGQKEGGEVIAPPFRGQRPPQENEVRHEEEESHLPNFGGVDMEHPQEVQTSEESIYRPHGGQNNIHGDQRPPPHAGQRLPPQSGQRPPQFNDRGQQRPEFNDNQRPNQFNRNERPQANDLSKPKWVEKTERWPPTRPPPVQRPQENNNNFGGRRPPQEKKNEVNELPTRIPPFKPQPPPPVGGGVTGPGVLEDGFPARRPQQPPQRRPPPKEATNPSEEEFLDYHDNEEFGQKESRPLLPHERIPPGQRPPPPPPPKKEEEWEDHVGDHSSAEDLFHRQQNTHMNRPNNLRPFPPSPPQPLPPPPLQRGQGHEVNNEIQPSRVQRPQVNSDNAATVYIINHVDEEEDEEEGIQEAGSRLPGPSDPERSNILRGQQPQQPHPHDEEYEEEEEERDTPLSTAFPHLVIKEIQTRPVVPYAPSTTTTTGGTRSPPRGRTTPVPPSPPPTSAVAPTTNKALISRLFIRRFSTPTPRTTSTTTSTARPPQTSRRPVDPFSFIAKSTMLGLPSGLGTTPAPFGRITTRSTTPRGSQRPTAMSPWNLRNRYGTPTTTTSTTRRPSTTTQRKEEPVEEEKEYLEEEGEELSGAGSNITEVNDANHPNHHPIHKPPIDVAKYLEGQDEFGQLYQGTEDSESVIDPVTSKVIRVGGGGPPRTSEGGIHNHRVDKPPQRNLSSAFMRRTTTLSSTTEDDDSVTEIGLIANDAASTFRPPSTLRASEEDAFLRKYTVPAGVSLSSPGGGGDKRPWWPTTFRPSSKVSDILEGQGSAHSPRVTTYRPPHKNEVTGNEIPSSLRPAPQSGMASFYDDEESMGELKVKNKELHRLPHFTRRPPPPPPTGQRPSSSSGHEVISLVRPSELSEYEASLERLKLQKGTEEGWEDNSAYEDEEEEEEPQKKTSVTPRPLSSLFRRPSPPPLPQGKVTGGQQQQSVSSSTARPASTQKSTSSNAIQLVKSVFPPEHKKTGGSAEVKAKGDEEEGSKVNGGHRESSYIYSSEYYEEDEEEDKANLIPPKPSATPPQSKTSSIQLVNRPPPPQPPQRYPPRPPPPGGPFMNQRRPPPPHPPGRYPPGIGGHKVNAPQPTQGGFKIFQSPGRPQPPQKIPPSPTPPPQQPAPKTEMEPPPIDSNRLAPPVLELPSSGPIRYKPSGPANANANVLRPNLLRPDDDLFKKANDPKGGGARKGEVIHTIASVDDNNAIIATNTFTAMLLPSKSLLQPTKASSSVAPVAIATEIEGSEVNAPQGGGGKRVSTVVKYTGGVLSTQEVHLEEEDTPPQEEEEEEEAGSGEVTSRVIQPTKASDLPKLPQRSRGTTTQKANDTASTSTTTTTKVSTSVSTSRETTTSTSGGTTSENVRAQILNRRPPTNTATSAPSATSPSSGGGLQQRRPFIPTRGPPGPNVIPWAKRTQSTTPRPTPTTVVLLQQTNRTTTTNTATPGRNASAILRFTPIGGGSQRGSVRLDLRRPQVTTPKTTITSSVSSSTSKESGGAVRRPGGFFSREKGVFSGSSEEVSSSASSGRRVSSSTTSTPTTTRKVASIFRNISTSTPPTSKATSTSTPLADDEEYEEYSYEVDEVVTLPPRVVTTPNVKVNVTVSSSTSTSTSTSTSGSQEKVTDLLKAKPSWSKEKTTGSSKEKVVEPTKVRGWGGSRERSSGVHRFRPASGVRPTNLPSMEENDVLPSTPTRYVTSTELVTRTMTETETIVVTEGGVKRTGTVFITKTIPPATRISTLVGSVTLVNTVDIRPTVVMTTLFADSSLQTKGPGSPPTFFDSTEHSNGVNDLDTEGNDLTPPKTKTSEAPPPSTTTTSKIPPGIVTKKTQLGGGGGGRGVVDLSGCPANCSLTPNQACRSWANGTRVRCDCRAGYARMKDKYPCRPTFTYEMRLSIETMEGMTFDFRDLSDASSDGYVAFIGVTKEAVDKAFLSTDIKRQFLGSEVIAVTPVKKVNEPPTVKVSFLVQLTTNISEERVRNHLLRTLKAANFSVGRNSGISASRNSSDVLARDFNECNLREFHDCSVNADCVNVKGSFTCRCKPGFKDRMKRRPGRDCQETPGCAECSFKGTCHVDSGGKTVCNCFKWYGGAECQINLKLPLIAVSGIGSVLFILVVLCGVLFARRSFSNSSAASNRPLSARIDRQGSGRFMRYRSPASVATLERTAIMGGDSASSEGRNSPHPLQPPPLPPPQGGHFTPDSLLIDVDPKVTGLMHSHVRPSGSHSDVNLMNFSLRNVIPEQNERGGSGLACVIPRAKIRPHSRPNSRHASVGADPSQDLAANERRLLSYLDQSPYAHMGTARAGSGSTLSRRNDSGKRSSNLRKLSLQEQRKISQGALVSSGTEVSAMGGMRRKSATGLDPPGGGGGHDGGIYSQYDKSVSEVRSFDETIRSPAKAQLYHHTHHTHNHDENSTRASCYSCKPPSYCTYSESAGHTMGDKDGASTVYTTQGKLFRLSHDHDDGDTSSTISSQ